MFDWLLALVQLAPRLRALEVETLRIKTSMANLETKFIEALAQIDAETNRIADVLTELKEQIKDAGIPAAKEEQILSLLEAQVVKLKGVGVQTPEPTPVPVPTPDPQQ